MGSLTPQIFTAYNYLTARHLEVPRLDQLNRESVQAFTEKIFGTPLSEEDTKLLSHLEGLIEQVSPNTLSGLDAARLDGIKGVVCKLLQKTTTPAVDPAAAAPEKLKGVSTVYDDLPDEMISEILDKLPPKEAARLAQVDRRDRDAFLTLCQDIKPLLCEGLQGHPWVLELEASEIPFKSAEILQRMVDYLYDNCPDEERSEFEIQLQGPHFGFKIERVVEKFREQQDQILVKFYETVVASCPDCSSVLDDQLSLNQQAQWIRGLPADHSLFQFEVLILVNCQLTALPIEIARFSKLKALFLSSNGLETLPAELGNLTQLEVLDLSSNRLRAIPANLGNLAELKVLQLGKNQLQAVPAELSKLAQLKVLYLNSNQLKVVPAELSNLAQLRELYLDNNRLLEVPVELGKLAELIVLDLRSNQLQKVPVELEAVKILRVLNLKDNPS